MSDFLNNLATRTLGVEPSVRPRLPSLFGPSAENALGAAPLLSDLEKEGVEEMAFQPVQSSRQHKRMVAGAENLRSEASRAIPTFNRSAINTATPTLAEENASLTPKRSRESVAPVVAPPFAPVEIRPVSAHEGLSPPTPIIGAISPSVPAPPAHIVRESVRETSRTEVIVPTETPRVKNAAALQPVEASARVTPRPPVPSPFAPTVKLAAPIATAMTFEATHDQATQQPTIHVTIGRIEVRAHPAPARNVASQTTKPINAALSLDDYLRERAGGRQ